MKSVGCLLAALILAPAADASCLSKRFSSWGEGYVYVVPPPAAEASFVGRFWQPGDYATTGDQGCEWWRWLHPYPPGGLYINGTLGQMGCPTGCPVGEMIVTVEARSTEGSQAFFAVERVDETAGDPEFDFSRTGGNWNLVPIPVPQVLASTSGEVFLARLFLPDPSAGFHGLPGMTAPQTITAFHVHRPGTNSTRDRSTWTFVQRVPYTGGPAQVDVTLVCPPNGSGTAVALALELDHGQVVTHYVSAASFVECDTYQPGAGAVDDGGADGLFVRREPTGELTLSWGASCLEGDRISGGYEVYEGHLGAWESHAPRTCSVESPLTSYTFAPAEHDAYYLVVPYEDEYEGSYGERSDLTQRPLGAAVCRQRVINVCPP